MAFFLDVIETDMKAVSINDDYSDHTQPINYQIYEKDSKKENQLYLIFYYKFQDKTFIFHTTKDNSGHTFAEQEAIQSNMTVC